MVVSKIADSIDAGFVYFLNPDTVEVEEFRKLSIDNPEEYVLITGESEEEMASSITIPISNFILYFLNLKEQTLFDILIINDLDQVVEARREIPFQ